MSNACVFQTRCSRRVPGAKTYAPLSVTVFCLSTCYFVRRMRRTLNDDGRSKGVLGHERLVSHRVGSRITIGPLSGPPPFNRRELPPRVRAFASSTGVARRSASNSTMEKAPPSPAPCAAVQITLGYLLASYPQGALGAIRIECARAPNLAPNHTGAACGCAKEWASYGSWANELNPYPIVQSDVALASDRSLRGWNASVTATTSFVMIWSAACRLHLHHSPALPVGIGGQRGVAGHRASQVRVASLSLRRVALSSLARMQAYPIAKAHVWAPRMAVGCEPAWYADICLDPAIKKGRIEDFFCRNEVLPLFNRTYLP